jgi:uncharacterized protein (TIGR02217 family)
MLWGISHGYPSHSPGAFGRSLLGYQTLRALGTPPVGSDSLKTRIIPNMVDGDIYIVGVATPYRFEVRQDGTYFYNAFGDETRQLIAVAAYQIATGLVPEGILAVNDDAPRPVGATLFGSATYAYGQPLNVQLAATDLQGDAITFAVQAGALPPGLSMSSSGVVTGTPSAYGIFGFTVRLSDPYGAFTDSIEQVTIAAVLPNFVSVRQLIAQAEATVTAMGLSFSASSVVSALPLNTVVSQSPAAGTVVTSSTTVIFTYSDGSLFTQPSNVFPTNITGLTWKGTRSMLWRTSYQEALTGKVTTFAYQKFPIIEWTLNYSLLNQAAAQDDLRKIEGLFNAQQGGAGSFLYIDPTFNSVTAEPFGTGDGTTKAFQLIARYGNPGGPSVAEIIQKLQPTPAVQIFDNGTLVPSSSYSIGVSGIVTFNTAPLLTHALTWAGSFYYQCRFETDDLDPSEFMQALWELQSLKLRSVIV